jgi:hypothetical protein
MNFLFVLLDKIKNFTSYTVYFPRQLLHMLFLYLETVVPFMELQLCSDILRIKIFSNNNLSKIGT